MENDHKVLRTGKLETFQIQQSYVKGYVAIPHFLFYNYETLTV